MRMIHCGVIVRLLDVGLMPWVIEMVMAFAVRGRAD